MHDVIPGILEQSFEEIEKKFEIIKPFSRSVHVDILDGKFSPEKNFIDPAPFKKYQDEFLMEVHLMVENPTLYLKPFANAGFKRFIGQIEKMQDLEEFIAQGQILGEVGIAIDYQTPLESLKLPLQDLDLILIMAVHAGKSGQEFLTGTFDKIKTLRNLTQIPIEVDGGINDTTLIMAKKAGANRFVATSYIFASNDPMQAYEHLLPLK